jgi:hypothetical protein
MRERHKEWGCGTAPASPPRSLLPAFLRYHRLSPRIDASTQSSFSLFVKVLPPPSEGDHDGSSVSHLLWN